VETAQLATKHFQRTRRPLRIAVDEAGWRFNNINEHQVKAIREKSGEPAFQGIEKQLFWRICRLLKQNIELVFVFDGSRRPWKNGKTAGRIDYKSRELTEELLDALRIPHYRAPAETEAECVRLQQLGVVDAVWSEDADALMFGCDFLIRDYREPKKKGEKKTNHSKAGTKKSNTHVRVIRPKHLQAVHLSKEDIVLFAVVCGGDYDREGLRNCGRNTAMKMIKHGLAKTLYACKSENDLGDWRHALIEFLRRAKATSNVIVRNDYPRLRHVKNYREPLVSTNEAIANLECLRHGWDRSFDEEVLREFISTRFNIWTKGYFNWIGPILLARFLSISTARSNPHAVRLTKRRAAKSAEAGEEEVLPSFESKLTFSPFDLSSLSQDRFHDGYWTGKREDEFEPDYRVECEILDRMLRQALPDEVLNPPAKTPAKKRKRATQAQGGEDGT
ncbi:PIN domain-like protein, partial [Mytilinidion resinicola]